jgi:alkanesulfonate monooxygenase SsuD/methylene tetrahydromethanopterin reductase-like flavin-dependent oxidoreductase (luciferase family)
VAGDGTPKPPWEIAIQVRGPYEEVLGATRWAESFGLAAVALPDHYLASGTELAEPAWDSLTQLAGLARETTRIELVDLVSPVTFRHPAVYAKSAITLAAMSNDRFSLGIGTGWMEEEHRIFGFEFPPVAERFRMLEEALGYLDAMAHGFGFDGRHYQLESVATAPPFRVPIVVGGSGLNKTPELAGHFAREYNLFPNKLVDIPGRIERCLQTGTLRGRAPAEIRLSFTCIAVGGLDERAYRERLKKEASELGREPDQLDKRLGIRGIPHGTREQVVDQIGKMTELGISRIYLQCGTTDPTELEELVAPFLP